MLRRSAITCHFCNAPVLPKDPANFGCPHCGSVNRFVNGNLVDPAMFNLEMNTRSFVRQRNDRLPAEFGRRDILCHSCQRNATLVVQLLANYVEGSEDENSIEQYRESLSTRYPLVCDSCQSSVDAEINKKNAMARSQALGAWLNQTRGKVKQRQNALPHEHDKLSRELLIWRLRGGLWATTIIISLLSNATAGLGWWPSTFNRPWLLLSLNILAIFWSFWDPTYSSFRSAKLQGRQIRVQGKKIHIGLQLSGWITRVTTSLLIYRHWSGPNALHLVSTSSRVYLASISVIELACAILPFFILRLQQPPAIRLIDTARHKADTAPSRTPTPVPGSSLEPELFAGLSFSSKPVLTPPRKAPVFGVSSMLPSSNEHVTEADEMDVDIPAAPKTNPEPIWLRPQRFFAPEAPTGLESLFEMTKIGDEDVTMGEVSSRQVTPQWKWWWVYAPSVLVLLALGYNAWGRSKNANSSQILPTIPPTSQYMSSNSQSQPYSELS
ncbi:Ima1-N domain-containing protein [Mycena indigotica]|uniref:Ima1-N domain-containing protein n=1 Tax=Mycena indigotica TaxID=2126181 RepID=A0A8H6WBX4_9AGAR|nr:Ima1-N domain-containing protein [Mycena indigotica]KAF7306774.1 Ima1-N domain-containing protein [Mycena indigotica]